MSDLVTLADNGISKGYERDGSFVLNLDRIANGVDVNGIIYTSPLSPYKYHESVSIPWVLNVQEVPNGPRRT